MASILMLTADTTAVTATTLGDALTGLGHTVTLSQATTAVDLDAAWATGFDVLAVQDYSTATAESSAWVAAKWDERIPVLLGSGEDGIKTALGINSQPSEVREVGAGGLTLTGSHQITTGLSSPVTYRTGTDTMGSFQWAGALHGVNLGTVDRIGYQVPAMTAVDELGTIEGGDAPTRAVWLGWARTDATFTADALTMIGRSVDWLLAVEPGGIAEDPTFAFTFNVTGPDSVPAGPLLIDRAPAPAPPLVTERPLMLHAPQPTPGDFIASVDGSVHSRGLWDIHEGTVGTPHVWVDGIDITYLRGAPVILDNIAASEPGGWESATLTLPQVSVLEQGGLGGLYPSDDLYPSADLYPGSGDLAWMRPDAQIEAHLVDETGAKIAELFSGHLVNDAATVTSTETATVWECAGDMDAAAYYLHRPPIQMDPTDIGILIPKALNSVVSRRYGTVPTVVTGITPRRRGSGDDYVWEYASELLADAWTDDHRQWTIARTGVLRQYEMRLKDTSTAHWTVVPGTPGIDIRLDADHASRSDAIMGRGVGPDGYAWSGREWPSMLDYDPPDYPYNNASTVITIGTTDADTDTGDGVSVWQQRAVDLGYDIAVDGVFDSADSQVVRQIQRRMGAQVDGVIGPQTWTATWEVGVDAGALESIRLPLAYRPEVEPHLYAANGAITGTNPDYDPSVVRRERAIDYGAQVTKAEGARSARREVTRTQDPGWYGDITFEADPREGSRHLIREGDNIRILSWRGENILAHAAKVTRSLTGTAAVKVTVDTKARDAMTLASLRRRDREAMIDPARRPGNVNRKSRQAQDVRTEFEGDSPAGRIHRRALFAGLWSVFPIPISEAGDIVKLDVRTTSPAVEFSIGFFASPVQPSHLKRLVGNPAADSSAWRTRLPELEDLGYIESWGAGESMAGHWPDQDGPVTGRLTDVGGWSYHSNAGGWVWVAAYSPVSTFISGRVYPAPIDS